MAGDGSKFLGIHMQWWCSACWCRQSAIRDAATVHDSTKQTTNRHMCHVRLCAGAHLCLPVACAAAPARRQQTPVSASTDGPVFFIYYLIACKPLLPFDDGTFLLRLRARVNNGGRGRTQRSGNGTPRMCNQRRRRHVWFGV
jgi:hypothetical protein